MINRRDFLKGFSALALDALLARRHGVLIPGREQLVQWGKENGVLRPQWDGIDFVSKRIVRGVKGTLHIKISDLFGGYQEWVISADRSCYECVDMSLGFLVPKRYQKELIEVAKLGQVVCCEPTTMPLGYFTRSDIEALKDKKS